MMSIALNMDTEALDADLEEEVLYDGEGDYELVSPFDPKQVDIEPRQMVISNIVDRLEHGEIELNPDFQRKANLWDKKTQSRLIESLLIRIPLPVFYFDMSDDEKLIVVCLIYLLVNEEGWLWVCI